MLASLYKKNTVLNFALETIKRARRRARYYTTVFCKDTIMAWTKEAILIRNPAHLASQMCTDIGHRNKIPAIRGQYVN
jgi:hypothetical protein